MTHTRQKGSLSREHMARRGHSARRCHTGRQDLFGRRQNPANASGRSLPRHFLNELSATKEGVAQWNKGQSEKPKEEQEVLDRKQYPLRRRGGLLVDVRGSQLAQNDNRAQVRCLAAQHRPKAKVSNVPVVRTSKAQVRNVPVVRTSKAQVRNVPVVRTSKAQVRNVPVARCSKAQMGRLPVERTSKAHVRRLPVASSSRAQVAGLPVGGSSRGQVQSLHVAGSSKRQVRRLPVRNDSRGQVRSLPVQNSSRVKVLGAPVQRQSKAQVGCLRVQQNCSKAQVRSCSREHVDSTPLQRPSKPQVGSLPARCSSRRKMDNAPSQKPSKAETDSSPLTQSLKAQVKSLPVRCSPRRQVLGLPVRVLSRGKVGSLPVWNRTKAEVDIPLRVSSTAQVDSAPARCSPRGQVDSATPVGASSAAQASGRGMGGQSPEVCRGRSSSKNFDNTNTVVTNPVVTSNTRDSQPCTDSVQSKSIKSDSPESQTTADSTNGADTGRCTGLQSQPLRRGRSSAKTSQNTDPAVTKPAGNSDRRNSSHSKPCTGPAVTGRCPREQSAPVQSGRSSTNTKPTARNLVDQRSAGGGKPSRTETAVTSDRRTSGRYSSKNFDNTNTAVTHPAVTSDTRGSQPSTDPPVNSDNRYPGERRQELRRGRSSVKTSHATDATKPADNSDSRSTAVSKPCTDATVTGRRPREKSEPIHRGRSSANTDPTATNPSDTSDQRGTGDGKPSRTERAVSSDSRTTTGSRDAVDTGKYTGEQSQTLRRGRSSAKNSDTIDTAVTKAGLNSDWKNLTHSEPCTDSAVKSDSCTTPDSRERVGDKLSVVTLPTKQPVNSCPANTLKAQHQRRESSRLRNASPNGSKSDNVNTTDMSDSKLRSDRTIAANTVRAKEQVESSCTGRERLQVASAVTRHAKQQLKSCSPGSLESLHQSQDSSSLPCQLKEQVPSSCTPRTKHRSQESSPSPPPSSTLSVPLQARKSTLQAKPKATPCSPTGPIVQHPKQDSPRSTSASPGQLPHKRESRSPITSGTQHQKQGSPPSAPPCTSPTQLPLLPRKGRLQQSRKSFPLASRDAQHQKRESSSPQLPLSACKQGTVTVEPQNQNQEGSPSPSPPPSASESSAQLPLPALLPRKCRLASPNAELQLTTHPITPGIQCQSQDHKRPLQRQKSSPSPTPDPQHQKLEASPPSHPPSPQHPSVSVRVEHQKYASSSCPSPSRSPSPSPPPLLLLPRKRRLASLNAEAVNSLLLELHPSAAKLAKKQLQDGPPGEPATAAATAASSSPTTDCPVEPVSAGKPQPCQSHKQQQQQHKEQHKLQQQQQKNQPHKQQQNQTQQQEQETLQQQQQQPLKRKPKPAEKQDFIDWNMFAPTPRRMAGLNAAALLRLTSSSAASSKQHAKPDPKSPPTAVEKTTAKARTHTAVAKRPHHHQHRHQHHQREQQQRKRKASAQRSTSSSSSSAIAGPGSPDYRKGGFELSPCWEEEAVERPHVAKAGYQQAGVVMEVTQYPLNQVKEEQVEEPISHTHCCCGTAPQGAPLDFCCHQLGIYIRQQHGYPEPQEGPFTAVRQQPGYPGEPGEGPFTPVKHECLVTSLPPHPSSLAHPSLAISSPHPCLCADHCFPSYYVHMPHPHHSFCPTLRAPCYSAIPSYAYGTLPHVNSRGCCFTSGCCRCRQHVKTEGYLSPPRHRDSRSPPSLPLSGCPLPRVTSPPPAPVPPHPPSPDTRHHHHERRAGDPGLGGGGRVECPQGRKPSNGSLPGRRPPPSPKQPEVTVPPSGRQKKLARRRTTNGWRAVGKPVEREVFVVGEDEPVVRVCFEGVRRGRDLIGVRDTVLLRSGPRKKSDPYVAKVSAIWEEPKTGELMMSLFWYYRPEHTQGGRDPNTHCQHEIFASKHQDVNSVACIEDKCYVLPLAQYCRYCALVKRRAEGVCVGPSLVPSPCDPPSPTPPYRCVPQDVAPELVYLCRHVYDFRYGRLLKNPH